MGHRSRQLVAGTLVAALIGASVVVGLTASGCTRGSGAKVETEEPAEVQPIEGGSVSLVTLTEDAYARLGIRTSVVRRDSSSAARSPGSVMIPITALVYDPQGKAWTYTVRGPRAFARAPLVIKRINGGTVHLSSGPPAGTKVVTVGAQELLGADYGVGGE